MKFNYVLFLAYIILSFGGCKDDDDVGNLGQDSPDFILRGELTDLRGFPYAGWNVTLFNTGVPLLAATTLEETTTEDDGSFTFEISRLKDSLGYNSFERTDEIRELQRSYYASMDVSVVSPDGMTTIFACGEEELIEGHTRISPSGGLISGIPVVNRFDPIDFSVENPMSFRSILIETGVKPLRYEFTTTNTAADSPNFLTRLTVKGLNSGINYSCSPQNLLFDQDNPSVYRPLIPLDEAVEITASFEDINFLGPDSDTLFYQATVDTFFFSELTEEVEVIELFLE